MIPRVWRHFFKNLAWPVGFAVYIVAVAFGAAYADTLFQVGAVAFVFFIVPVLIYLIRDMWRYAKQKVEWENEEMMRRLKGE